MSFWKNCNLTFSNKSTQSLYLYIYIYKKYIYIYMLYIYICIYVIQAFWQSSAPGPLSTLVTSVVLFSLTRATLMSPGKDETRVCGHIYLYIYIYIYIYIMYIYNIYTYSFWAKAFQFHIESWPLRESNPRPRTYRAHALTTQLSTRTMRCLMVYRMRWPRSSSHR